MGRHLTDSLGMANSHARVGGEEFAAFLPSANAQAIESMATKISAGFHFCTGEGISRKVAASVGVATYHGIAQRSDALRLADDAVYKAKSAGRACYVVCSDQEADRRDRLAAEAT